MQIEWIIHSTIKYESKKEIVYTFKQQNKKEMTVFIGNKSKQLLLRRDSACIVTFHWREECQSTVNHPRMKM